MQIALAETCQTKEKDGRILKYILYGELIVGKHNLARPPDVYKRDMKKLGIDRINGKNWQLSSPSGEVIYKPP